MCSSTDTRATVRSAGFRQNRVAGFPRPTRHSLWPPAVKFAPCEPYVESQVLQLFGADTTFTHVEPLARIRRMRPSLTFSISLIIAANLHTAIAQSSPTPAPTPVTLRSLLLSELHSTHDKAEWFTPIQAAVAGLT